MHIFKVNINLEVVMALRSLTDFLSSLPGVMPIKARNILLKGDLLSKEERDDICPSSNSIFDTVLDVGPTAAEAILLAYKSGRLPMKRGAKPMEAPIAEDYVAKRNILKLEVAERHRKERALTNPSLILEDDFNDFGLMNQVFFKNIGQGSGSMVLAGISVHKEVTSYKSNSGKSTVWKVRFDWIGSDGRAHRNERIPLEANNRRNDSSRNWGLPE
ncbi:MAG: hypothetical protein LDL07_06170 [Desulfarculus sp.]|nr:hypothetical protein [Desulfarculus sp.]